MNQVTQFVRDVLERAVKTAAQGSILSLGVANVGHLDAFTVNWAQIGGFAVGGFVLSVLTSLASQPVGDKSSASLLKSPPDSTPALPATQTADISDL